MENAQCPNIPLAGRQSERGLSIFLILLIFCVVVGDYAILIVKLKRAKDKVSNRYEEYFYSKVNNLCHNEPPVRRE